MCATCALAPVDPSKGDKKYFHDKIETLPMIVCSPLSLFTMENEKKDVDLIPSQEVAMSGADDQTPAASPVAASAPDDDESTEIFVERTQKDVLCGRGVHILHHLGNLRLHLAVNAYREEYIAARRDRKREIITRIIHDVKASGSRFLKRSKQGSNLWVEADEYFAYQKVSHALRGQNTGKSVRDANLTNEQTTALTAERTGSQPRHQQPPVLANSGTNADEMQVHIARNSSDSLLGSIHQRYPHITASSLAAQQVPEVTAAAMRQSRLSSLSSVHEMLPQHVTSLPGLIPTRLPISSSQSAPSLHQLPPHIASLLTARQHSSSSSLSSSSPKRTRISESAISAHIKKKLQDKGGLSSLPPSNRYLLQDLLPSPSSSSSSLEQRRLLVGGEGVSGGLSHPQGGLVGAGGVGNQRLLPRGGGRQFQQAMSELRERELRERQLLERQLLEERQLHEERQLRMERQIVERQRVLEEYRRLELEEQRDKKL